MALPNAHRCLEALRTDPLSRANWNRQHQLRGRHATREWKGSELEQWEYEITSGGRVRYLASPETSTVILVYASRGTRRTPNSVRRFVLPGLDNLVLPPP